MAGEALIRAAIKRALERGARGFDNPHVGPWFHGSTHDVKPGFDISRGNPENYFGSYPHMTSDPLDASHNYAGVGPDLTNRIADLIDRLSWDEELGSERDIDEVGRIARERLIGPAEEGVIYPLMMRTEKPFLIGQPEKTWVDFSPEFNPNDEDELIDNPNFLKLFGALEDAGRKYSDFEPSKVLEDIGDVTYDEVSGDELHKALRKSEALSYAQNDEGRLVNSQIIADIIKALGYDSIIMNANEAFPGMVMRPGTRHAIPLGEAQVRSPFAKFNPRKRRDPDFLAGLGGGAVGAELIRRALADRMAAENA